MTKKEFAEWLVGMVELTKQLPDCYPANYLQLLFNFSVKIKIPLAQRNLMYFPSLCLLPGVFVVSYLFVT